MVRERARQDVQAATESEATIKRKYSDLQERYLELGQVKDLQDERCVANDPPAA